MTIEFCNYLKSVVFPPPKYNRSDHETTPYTQNQVENFPCAQNNRNPTLPTRSITYLKLKNLISRARAISLIPSKSPLPTHTYTIIQVQTPGIKRLSNLISALADPRRQFVQRDFTRYDALSLYRLPSALRERV